MANKGGTLANLGQALSGYGSALSGNPMYLQNSLLLRQAQQQQAEREQQQRQDQTGNAAALSYLRSGMMEGTPATKQMTMQGPAGEFYPAFAGGNRTIGQNREATPVSTDPLRSLALFANGSTPLQSIAAKRAIDQLYPQGFTGTVGQDQIAYQNGKVVAEGPKSVPKVERFEVTNMQIPGTDRVALARTQEEFDRLANQGFVKSGTSVPGARLPQVTDPYKRVDYWRDKIDPEFKAVNEASVSLQKIENAISSGASLNTAIQLLQKIIDERGVVRGEDVRMFTDAQPLIESWKQELEQSKSGKLTPESAQRVLSTARALISARYNAFNNNFQAISPLMQAESVDPYSVVPQQVLDRFSTRRFQPPAPPPGVAGTAQAAGGIPRPQSQEEYNSLASGAVYIDPDDGRQYRKP